MGSDNVGEKISYCREMSGCHEKCLWWLTKTDKQIEAVAPAIVASELEHSYNYACSQPACKSHPPIRLLLSSISLVFSLLSLVLSHHSFALSLYFLCKFVQVSFLMYA